MNDKKYQVFVSSTFSDLIDERRKVINILLSANCIPSGMEVFIATDNEQFEVIKKIIDLCDYYILIIGKRYGTVNPNTSQSYTEMEYDYAIDQGIPVLVFAIDESVELQDSQVEKDKVCIEKLELFRLKAMYNRLAKVWKTTDDLIGAVAVAINSAISDMPRPGWQRATNFDEASLRREIMELQDKNSLLVHDLASKQLAIDSLTKQSDLAFEDCIYTIDYSWKDWQGNISRERGGSIEINLVDIFKVISTEMMDVAITEIGVQNIVQRKILNSKSIKDSQIIKVILNQLKALGLIYSKWNDNNTALFWGLTAKGVKMRDDIILVRKSVKTDS